MDQLDALRERVEALAGLAEVDPRVLSGDAALSWVKSIGEVLRAGETLLAPFAVRLEELTEGPSRYARWKGHPSAAALIAHVTGISQSQAMALGALGRVMTREIPVVSPEALDFDSLPDAPPAPPVASPEDASPQDSAPRGAAPDPLPPVRPQAPVMELSPLAKAARDRTLSTEAIRVIETTLEAMTIDTAEVEAVLVSKARGMKIREVRRLCHAVFAEWDRDGYEARQEAQRPQRELVFFQRRDGMVGVHGTLDAASAASVAAVFDAEASAALHGQRELPEDERRSLGQINVDILVQLARHAQGCDQATTRPKTTVVVRVDEKALREDVGLATCDALEGPISMQTLRRMAVDAEVVPVVMGGGSLPLDVGRAARYATPAIRVALGERDKGCAMCSRPLPWCDAHHIDFWSHGGRTSTRNMVMLCVGCHHRVHDCGWIIEVDDRDNVSFIPPATVDPHRRRQPASSARFAA